MSKDIQAIRGMNDCLPADTPAWQYVEQIFAEGTAVEGGIAASAHIDIVEGCVVGDFDHFDDTVHSFVLEAAFESRSIPASDRILLDFQIDLVIKRQQAKKDDYFYDLHAP